MSQKNSIKEFVAGGFGGVCLILVGYPFDTIKVRLQTMPSIAYGAKPIYSGTYDCVKKTMKLEGFKGLFGGILMPLVYITPLNAFYFLGYSLTQNLQIPSKPNREYSMDQIFTGGIVAGIFSVPIMVPGQRIKSLLQVQPNVSKLKYNGAIDCIKKVYLEGGLKSLYKGTFATIIRDLPGGGIYFSVYELIKRGLDANNANCDATLTSLKTMFSGGTAGMAAWVIMLPVDTVKSRIQTSSEQKGFLDVCVKIMRYEGISAFYKGFTAVLLRAFPANAACFLGYEFVIKFM